MNFYTKQIMITRSKNFFVSVIRGLFIIAMCFIVLYPIFFMLSMSLRTSQDMFDPTVIWIPKNSTIKNFTTVIKMMDYFPKLFKSFQISFIATFLNVVICAFAGYGLARFNFKFKGLLFGLVLFSIIVPPQCVSIPMYMGYKNFDILGFGSLVGLFTGKTLTLNLINTEFVIYIPAILGAGIKSGLFIYIFRQFFRNMPKELEDAAWIDGCSITKTYFRIMIPNASSAFVVCALLSFVWYWNDYTTISMYFNEPITLSASLTMIVDVMKESAANLSEPYAMDFYKNCACLLSIIPLLILYVFVQRLFTESIDKSGIVG